MDGAVLDQAPIETLQTAARQRNASGLLNAVAVIIGSNNRDGITPFYNTTDPKTGEFTNRSFVPTETSDYVKAMISYWTAILNQTSPNLAKRVLSMYPIRDFGYAAAAFVAADGDFAVRCPQVPEPCTHSSAHILESVLRDPTDSAATNCRPAFARWSARL